MKRDSLLAIYVAEYPGDEAWRDFAHALGSVDDGIANVVTARLGPDGPSWLRRAIPTLGGRSAEAVMAADPLGTVIVRSVIMRMP